MDSQLCAEGVHCMDSWLYAELINLTFILTKLTYFKLRIHINIFLNTNVNRSRTFSSHQLHWYRCKVHAYMHCTIATDESIPYSACLIITFIYVCQGKAISTKACRKYVTSAQLERHPVFEYKSGILLAVVTVQRILLTWTQYFEQDIS